MKTISILAILLVGLVGAGLVIVLTSGKDDSTLSGQSQYAENAEPYREIVDPSGFVNTDGEPVTVEQFVGKKVILVDFLTYSCINCQRTFPYLNAWWDKYKDMGLQIIGIHTPEFAFEKDIDNVRAAMEKFGITYPIVLDNDYATWRNYENSYWPRKYLIDIHGNIVYDHIGEGAYDETEKKIQELLKERADVLGDAGVSVDDSLVADMVSSEEPEARSPETYFGASRNEYLTNGTAGATGEQKFPEPSQEVMNRLYLGGVWNIQPEYAQSVADASIAYRFNAKNVYIVAEADAPVTVQVLIDGQPISDALRGGDVSADGAVTIKESGLYDLVKGDALDTHLLELRVQGAGLRAYTFTFG